MKSQQKSPDVRVFKHTRRGKLTIGFLLAVLLVSTGVLWARHSHTFFHKAQESSPIQQSAKPATTTPTTSTKDATNALDPNQGYVVIQGWGVRFKAAAGLGTVQYKLIADQQVLGFTTSQLAALDPGCAVTGEAGSAPLGWLERSRTALQTADGTVRQPKKVIGEYSYYFTGPQATCLSTEATDTEQNEQLTGQQALLLEQSLDSLEVAQ